jgi:hypothetical protein
MRVDTVSCKWNAVTLNSGEPVAHSGPGLIAPSIPPTAGRTPETCSKRLDSHQPKSGQGLGRSPIGGEAAVPSCFINKRVIVTATQCRKRGCGAWTVHGLSIDSKFHHYIRLNCKCWDCPYCGPRRAKRYRRAIGVWAEKLGLNRFLTLTLDPKKLDREDSTKYLKRTWAKLRSLIHRKYGKALPYICVLEYQKNGTAHLHILLNQRVEIDWLKEKWQAVGGGWNVWIKMVSIRRIVNYVSKYLSKDLMLSAPKGARRVTTSRDIRMFEKAAQDIAWNLIKIAIEAIRFVVETTISDVFCETEGIFTAFTVAVEVA